MRQQIRFCNAPDGARLAYATAGAGPPLVRAGNWLTHLELDWQSPVWRHWLEALSAHHTLVRYDLRGSGLSDADVGDASLDTWVSDLETVVDDLGLERFPLLGLCQGGAIAVAYAARHPERVSHLVLYDAYTRGAFARGSDARLAKEARSLTSMIEVGWGKDTAAFRELFAKLLMPEGAPEHVQWLGELQRQTVSPDNAARLWRAFHKLDIYELAAQVRVPTLVVHVQGDCVVPFEAGQELATRIPGAQFVGLEGRNHILRADEPSWQRFVDEVRAFLGEGSPPAVDTQTPFAELTRREREVLDHVARGASNAEIAAALGLTDKTVRNHISNILDKLGVEGRSQAIVRARDGGFG